MNKSDFLKKLSKLLHMLQEEEVRDIISEYEQHIDMKVAEGMSESEAIAAFGTVEELAREILDAYHVKADFKENKKNDVIEKVQSESKKAMRNAGEAGKGFFNRCSSGIKSLWAACKKGLKKIANVGKKCCLSPYVFIKNLFKKKDEAQITPRPVKENKTWKIGSWIKALFKGILRLMKKIWYGCLLAATGITGILLILLVGILIVLMFLGYPVIGITLASVGAAMVFNAAAYYAGIKWRRV